MTEHDTIGFAAHPIALLLPAYLNATLAEEDRQRVAEHLERCADCRRELDEFARLREQMREVYAAEPGPSAAVSRAVMAQAKQERAPGSGTRSVDSSPAREWIARLDDRLRSLFGAPWAPTFAAALVLAQLGLLAWTALPPTGESGSPSPEVVSRSVSAPIGRLRVGFQTAATDQQIQSVLKEIRGRIVDGPTAQGLYIVEVPVDGEAVARSLELLRARSEIVRSAEPAPQ